MIDLKRPIHGGNLDWAMSLMNHETATQVVDFSASINPLGPPQSAIASLKAGIVELNHYPNPDYPQFRLGVANHHHLDEKYILPSNGAAELLTWIAWECHELEGVLLPSPCFADYKRALKTFGVKYQFYPLDDLDKGINSPQSSRLAILINNPHNPTGKLWTRLSLQPYLEKFALVIVDEAFMDFLPPQNQESLIDFIKDYDNLVILRSLTKFYSLPGLRIGYGISNPQTIAKWQKWRDPWSVNSLAEIAAVACLQDKAFQEKTWQWLPPTRESLKQGLDNIEFLQVLPSQSNFLLVKTQIPSTQLQLRLLRQKQILIRDCVSFPELGEKYFRVAVKTHIDNQKLLDELNKLSKAIVENQEWLS